MNRLEARRLLTLLVVMLLAAAFVTLPAQAQEKKVLKVSIIPIADVAPRYAAVKQGNFKAQGLEIDTAPTAGGAVGIPGLLAGAYDIVFTNVVSTVQARAQGLPIKIIAPASAVGDGSQGEGGAAILVRKGEGLKTGADLVFSATTSGTPQYSVRKSGRGRRRSRRQFSRRWTVAVNPGRTIAMGPLSKTPTATAR